MLLNIVLRSLGKSEDIADYLLLFLMKFKLGLSFSALGVLFGIHRTTAMRHFYAVLKCLTQETRGWIFWPSAAAVRSRLPKAFREKYPNCRGIIDCTEVPICKPTEPHKAALMYSNYKGTYTMKFLVSVTPCGFISFLSKAYGGRASDSFVTSDSGFLELIEPGDLILSDKGFPSIKSSLEEGVIVMPPFARGGEQFSAEEVDETYRIASVRIHVERCIQRMKVYAILTHKMRSEMLSCVDDIIHMCAILANLQPPIIQEEAPECA
ncbi:uncharacterized protein LOC135372447 [Ornithodoros turicata]|uniref:uncharacterized protein LOC135372447 n=1 Tax=Ornithodoros turicata TaxID=34597 RepID=UPI003139C3A0